MFFLYLKSDGEISYPIHKGQPDEDTLDKKANCGVGSGIKWQNVDVFYAKDEDFPSNFDEQYENHYICNDYYVDVLAGELIKKPDIQTGIFNKVAMQESRKNAVMASLRSMTFSQVSDTVDSAFPDHSATQRGHIKAFWEVILYMAKELEWDI